MWQPDGPTPDLGGLDSYQPIELLADQIEKHLAITSEDFYGLMDTARLSIGQTLLWYPESDGQAFNISETVEPFCRITLMPT